jgi:hypothetical protein
VLVTNEGNPMLQLLRIAAGGLAAAGALATTLPVAEAAPAAGLYTDGGSCFYLNQILSTHLANPRTLYFRTSSRTYYRMDFGSDCNDMGTEPLIIHPFDNSGQICGAISVDVSVRETHQRCMPTSLRRMTADEVAATPRRDLP